MNSPILEVKDLVVQFPLKRKSLFARKEIVNAVNSVSFTLKKGEILGLVGESGSGKTTISRSILRLNNIHSGQILYKGQDITHLNEKGLKPFRKNVQVIFQDPYASLNPRLTIAQIIGEALTVNRKIPKGQKKEKIASLLEMVGLSPDYMSRYPNEFSGGQRQRIGIARTIAVEPELIIADEPVSALDASIQAQIINLLLDLQKKLSLTILFISHDLPLVEYLCDRIIVLYLGKVMETASAQAFYNKTIHPYSQALLSACPIPDPTIKKRAFVLKGDIPSPLHIPKGCVFQTRCPFVTADCRLKQPILQDNGGGHFSACHYKDLDLSQVAT